MAEPNQKPKMRRKLQFSLKGLLFMASFVGIVFAYWTNIATKQRKAVAQFEGPRVNGSVDYSPRFGVSMPQWLETSVGRDYFHAVDSASVLPDMNEGTRNQYRAMVNSELAIGLLPEFPNLLRIDIRLRVDPGLPVKYPDLSPLAECKSLSRIEIRSPMTLDVEALADCPSLKSLVLGGCTIDRDMMMAVSRCSKIRRLIFSHCTLSGDLLPLLSELPNLKWIHFNGCNPVSSSEMGTFNFEAIITFDSVYENLVPGYSRDKLESWFETVLPGVSVSGFPEDEDVRTYRAILGRDK